MKTTTTEMESLRAEVRALRSQIADLEAALCAVEDDSSEEEEFRALWPYNWIVAGIESVSQGFHSFQLRAGKRQLERYNKQQLDEFHGHQSQENSTFEYSGLRAV